MAALARLWKDRRGRLVEDALTLPVILLVVIALFNLALFGVAALNASNAAHYGARMGSVAQAGAARVAAAATWSKLRAIPIGDYRVSVAGDFSPGGRVTVTVTYRVPNFFAGLIAMFGGSVGDLEGQVTATFRKEGWSQTGSVGPIPLPGPWPGK